MLDNTKSERYKCSNVSGNIPISQFAATSSHDLSNICKMESNNGNKPALRLSPRVKELLGLESRVTIGGFDPMPYFSRKVKDLCFG
jgi:hypothetical protein